MATTCPEQKLLLCVARRQLDERREEEFRTLLATPLDWDYLISTARKHGLIPLLYRHLNAVACGIEPAHFDTIKQESVENCQSVLHLSGRLTKLLKLFDENRVPVSIFKGSILAKQAYGENSLRQAGDVDILIDRANFEIAKTSLESLGYRMVPVLTLHQLAAHLNFHCEIQFVRDNWFTVVDLHWALTPKAFPVELHTCEVLARSQTLSIGGMRINTFDPEDLILFQCVHGAKHYWSRLEWIASLAELIRNQEKIDWDVLIHRADDARALKMLALGVNLAKQLGDVDIPDAVLTKMEARGSMRRFASETLTGIFEDRETEYPSVTAIRKNLQIMDRKRDVLASMLRVTFVPTLSDWQSLTLPKSLHTLYYFLRPLRLMKNYSGLLFRRIFFAKEKRTAAFAPKRVSERLSGGLID